jgi:hypothetical protein
VSERVQRQLSAIFDQVLEQCSVRAIAVSCVGLWAAFLSAEFSGPDSSGLSR